jgi:hypothetical protein
VLQRSLAILALVSLCAAATAGAAPRDLWPGVTYEHGVQFTNRGPVAINVLRGPRPGGLTTLEPVLSNGTIVGRETLTAMQKRLRKTATVAGVNGDYFTFATGQPSGVLMQEARLVAPPNGRRASAGLTTDGTLDIRRVALAGTWRTTVATRPLRLNVVPGAGGAALFTDAYGPTTPALPGSAAVVLFPFPVATPDVDLVAQVAELLADGAPVPIPPGGAVLVGQGPSAAALTTEAPVGATLTVRLALQPAWPGIVAAIGGGPQIVRNGAPVFNAGELFTTRQLGPRAPRSAVGQLRDGRIVLVAVDGRQPGYSVGLTNFELAQALVRLGAVTGMALDSGGSTTMAFDGGLLNRPSDGGERRISTALMFLYRGVFAPEPPARVSPNGDGVDESPNLRYRVVRQSTTTVRLRAPDGSTPVATTVERAPGTYLVALPAGVAEAGSAAASGAMAPGEWTFEVEAVDELGNASSITRTFVVDNTLGFLRVPARAAVPPAGRAITIRWRLFEAARVAVVVRDASGRVVRRVLATGELEPGEHDVTWDGLGVNRRRLAGGYAVEVKATSSLGISELRAPIELRMVRR